MHLVSHGIQLLRVHVASISALKLAVHLAEVCVGVCLCQRDVLAQVLEAGVRGGVDEGNLASKNRWQALSQ
ncbi:hypothetical protein BDZ85DRAFT_268421 [Elsinoe ampelina]|uniref:Uncharacterized protein n=1 Tax=Elsinoe ampelina TaxID=302913 RepID=A0A6A6G121_9PEZI|nr:hypothetical protein BDZ85DRAFT_268421 [Elsinoe ampelina]